MIDSVPGSLLLIATVILFIAASEMGFWLGRSGSAAGSEADRKSHAGVVLGALLALLALSLAFSFSIAESRFVERRHLVLEEANAIGTTYLRAEMLPAPHGDNVQDLLREYVDMRRAATPETLEAVLAASEELHRAMWAEAVGAAERQPDPITGLFIQSLNQMIDLHEARVTVTLYQRMPKPIFVALYAIALLAMGSLGYVAGLARTRSPIPSLALMLAVGIVLLLVIDLDRPFQRVFEIDQSALDDVRASMRSDGPQAPPATTHPRHS